MIETLDFVDLDTKEKVQVDRMKSEMKNVFMQNLKFVIAHPFDEEFFFL